jgi:hypothetical protein
MNKKYQRTRDALAFLTEASSDLLAKIKECPELRKQVRNEAEYVARCLISAGRML